jgi:hypothetical protein
VASYKRNHTDEAKFARWKYGKECDLRLLPELQYIVIAFGLLPSVVFIWCVTDVSGPYIRPGSSEKMRNWDTQAYIGIAQGGVDQSGKKALGY